MLLGRCNEEQALFSILLDEHCSMTFPEGGAERRRGDLELFPSPSRFQPYLQPIDDDIEGAREAIARHRGLPIVPSPESNDDNSSNGHTDVIAADPSAAEGSSNRNTTVKARTVVIRHRTVSVVTSISKLGITKENEAAAFAKHQAALKRSAQAAEAKLREQERRNNPRPSYEADDMDVPSNMNDTTESVLETQADDDDGEPAPELIKKTIVKNETFECVFSTVEDMREWEDALREAVYRGYVL